jgi:sugar/nucleoside kinase (ribokinase family)
MSITEFTKPDRKLIVGVGSALIDILAHEDDAFIENAGAAKGGMIYVDTDFIEQTLQRAKSDATLVPGGSACNTAVGVAKLGGQSRFVGKCGRGRMGDFLENDLKTKNVQPALSRSDSPTGRVLSIITPDAQRSMLTYLGASSETQPEEITVQSFNDAAIVHIEGYLLFNSDLIVAVMKAARAAGAKISLDLASYTVVEQSRTVLQNIITEYVDILMANEDEALAYTGHRDEDRALQNLADCVDIAILKVGKRGSYVAHAGKVTAIKARLGKPAVDTTGAGDLWASGFLFGLVNGFPIEKCGEIGAACGYEVCQVVGASIPEAGWRRIRKLLP